jgi:hypothetical protein
LAPFVIFSTQAKIVDNYKITCGEVVAQLPVVKGVFGCGEEKEFHAGFAITEKGSMNSTLWPQYVNHALEHYPDCSPTFPVGALVDGGPGKDSLYQMLACAVMGLYFFPGYPQGSSFGQECDQAYATLKPMMYDRCDLIEDTQRLGSKDVGLRVKHIGLIINGRPDDALENKPFTSTFTKENNLKWFANVGRAPNLTRKSLNDKRLRSSQEDIEDGVDSRARTSKAVQDLHTQACDKLDAAGYNSARIRKVHQPKAARPKKPATILTVQNGQLECVIAAIANCPRKSPGALLMCAGSRAMNSREVLLGKLYAFEAAAIKAKNVVIAERAKANVAKTLANALRDKIASSTHALTVDKCTQADLLVLLRYKFGAGHSTIAKDKW